MEKINILIDEKTQSTYISYPFKALGNNWTALEVTGRYNYVSICKKSNNPLGGVAGTDFKDWDEATRHYKSPAIKTALLMAEIEIRSMKNSHTI